MHPVTFAKLFECLLIIVDTRSFSSFNSINVVWITTIFWDLTSTRWYYLFAFGDCGFISSLKYITLVSIISFLSTPTESKQITNGEEIPLADLTFFYVHCLHCPCPCALLLPCFALELHTNILSSFFKNNYLSKSHPNCAIGDFFSFDKQLHIAPKLLQPH